MATFIYFTENCITGEKMNFVSKACLDVGTIVKNDLMQDCKIVDMDVKWDHPVSMAECRMEATLEELGAY